MHIYRRLSETKGLSEIGAQKTADIIIELLKAHPSLTQEGMVAALEMSAAIWYYIHVLAGRNPQGLTRDMRRGFIMASIHVRPQSGDM